MTSIFPKQYAVILTEKGILDALRLKDVTTIELVDPPPVAASEREVFLRFNEVVPGQIAVDVTTKDGKKVRHALTIGAADIERAETPRRLDPARPFLLVIVGILASSVAILVGTFAAISGKEGGGPLQPMLTEVMAWMAAVVVLSTVSAVVMQALRVGWLKIGSEDWRSLTAATVVCALLTAVPVYYGWLAARTAVVGGLTALNKGDDVPWIFGGVGPSAKGAQSTQTKPGETQTPPAPVASPAGPGAPVGGK